MKTIAIATLSRDDIRCFESASNKIVCARQALHPNAIPPYAPPQAADKFFREALFAYADAKYLQDSFWRDLVRRYGIAEKDTGKLYVDFETNKLLINE